MVYLFLTYKVILRSLTRLVILTWLTDKNSGLNLFYCIKNWNFWLRNSLVNVNKAEAICGFVHNNVISTRFDILSLCDHLRLQCLNYNQKQPPLENTTEKYLCWSLFLIKLQVFRPATLFLRDSNTGVSPWILQNFQKHLFWRTSANGCFSKVTSWNSSTVTCTYNAELLLNLYPVWSDTRFRILANPRLEHCFPNHCSKSEFIENFQHRLKNLFS